MSRHKAGRQVKAQGWDSLRPMLHRPQHRYVSRNAVRARNLSLVVLFGVLVLQPTGTAVGDGQGNFNPHVELDTSQVVIAP